MSRTESPFLTRAELAAMFGRTVRTIERWLSAGRLPCYRFPDGKVMVRRDDVESFMQHCFCPPVRRAKKARPKRGPLPWLFRQNAALRDGDLPANIPRIDLLGAHENPCNH